MNKNIFTSSLSSKSVSIGTESIMCVNKIVKPTLPMIIAIFYSLNIWAVSDIFEQGGISYKVDIFSLQMGERMHAMGAISGTVLHIPDSIRCDISGEPETWRVDAIGEAAFENSPFAEVSHSCLLVGKKAFMNSKQLKEITMPDRFHCLGDSAFMGCEKLEKINFFRAERIRGPGGFLNETHFGIRLFAGCKSLKNIDLSKLMGYFRAPFDVLGFAFENCTALKEITSNSGINIRGGAFKGCKAITDIWLTSCHRNWYVFPISEEAFDEEVYQNATLHVPHDEEWINAAKKEVPALKRFVHVVPIDSTENLNEGDYFTAKTAEGVSMEFVVKNKERRTCWIGRKRKDNGTAIDSLTEGTITIPDSINNYYVVGIEENAFKNCNKISEIVIPESIDSICSGAFSGCSGLREVSFEGEIKYLASNAFENIGTLEQPVMLEVPQKSYYNALFDKDGKLCGGYFTIVGMLTNTIDFSDEKVKAICIAKWDTDSDGELSDVEAANIKSLGYAFGLSSITTFDELRYFTGLTTIDEHAFDRCPNLQSITIPSQVTSIGRAAFSACGALMTVNLPEGLTTIDEMSFERCSGLKSITIPSKVTSIGRAAFSACSSLTTISLPEGLTSIPELCFERCSGLKSINIPASVNSIGNNAFAQCNSLEDIVSDILEPFDIDASVFTNTTYSSARLCVPKGAKSKYRNALGWKNFKNILEDGLGEAEINVVSIDIVGDGIVGTPHNYAIKLENVGSVDFTGTLYVWIYEDSEPIESYFNSYNGGIPASVAGTLSSEEDFYFNPSGIYYIWLTTDAEGKNILGSKKAFTVTPAATLTVGNYTRVYGDDNPEFKFTADKGGYNGTPEIICHAKVDSPAGTYPIVITQGGVDNDFVNYVNGTLTITKAPLTIMAGTYIKKQGEDNPDFTLTYKGFKNGETEAVLTKKPTVTTSADWNSPVGVYDVIVTGAEAKNYEISYVAGTLTVEKRPKGDLNAKGYTDVTDVVAAINHALGERTLTYDEKEMLDMNDDGELNVGDIILLVKAILEQGNVVNIPVMARGETEDIDLTKYTAMQLTMNVPAGARIRDIRLAGDNNSSHQLMYQQKDAEHYTVVVYSMSNQTFKPVSGCLLEVDMEGEGEPTTANVLLATPAGERTFISSLPIGTVTGISIVGADQIAIGSVYDLRGNKVLDRGASMKRLPKGVYIMNGKKIIR